MRPMKCDTDKQMQFFRPSLGRVKKRQNSGCKGAGDTAYAKWTDRLSLLPEDVLWTTLGFLDLPTLYTARLVCKSFRRSAARHFRALDCTTLAELPTTDFTQFSGMTYLAVTLFQESQLQSLAHPWIAPVLTHVSLKGFRLRDRQAAENLEDALMRLPKLRSLSLEPLAGDLPLPLFPPRLEELKITGRPGENPAGWAGVRDASPLTRCSQLTGLAIDLVVGAGSSMGSLSSLHNLRSLDLCSCSSALGPLSTCTALTSLTFQQRYSGEHGNIFHDIGRLMGLSRLSLTGIETPEMVMHDDLTCIAQLTNLTCLDMSGCMLAGSVAGSTALAPLTRLVSVGFSNALRRPRLWWQINALQSLTLRNVSDVSFLRSATRLTHLNLSCKLRGHQISLPGLCFAVAGMSRLRSLEISFHHNWEDDYLRGADDGRVFRFQLDAVLRACTMLTKLAFRSGKLKPDSDLEACAALPLLRSLLFEDIIELQPARLPALQAMSGLTELSLVSTGIRVADMTPAVMAGFDAERRQLGWPLLKLRIEEEDGQCFERLEQ